jgi:hypothetical protein
VVDVDDFEAVESEHAAGPSYLLSDPDRHVLDARIAARASVAKGPSVVGFYRSHTRAGFGITMEDAYLFSTYFRKASDVFLLIKSNEGAPPTAGFIIREDGKVLADSPYLQFPFDQNLALQAAGDTPIPALPESSAPASAPQTVPSPPPQPPARMMPRLGWLAAAAVIALALGFTLGIQRREPPSATPKAALPLALTVTSTADGLRLAWDHLSSRRAGHAVLWIQDGTTEQRVELDSKQLSEGTITYWPRTSDVNFRLQLLAPGAPVIESVRAIGAPSRPPVYVPPPAHVAAAAFPAAPAKKPRLHSRTGMASRQRVRPFELTGRTPDRSAVAAVSLPDPPATQPLPPAIDDGFPQRFVPADGQVIRNDADSVHVSVERVPTSRLQHVARNIPLVGKRYRRSDYVPPAPLRKPAILNPPHRDVAHNVSIDVKVYVNPSGKVDYSEVVSKVAHADLDLAAAAVFSARRCEFVPARDAAGTVPGEAILHYQFGPSADGAADQPSVSR